MAMTSSTRSQSSSGATVSCSEGRRWGRVERNSSHLGWPALAQPRALEGQRGGRARGERASAAQQHPGGAIPGQSAGPGAAVGQDHPVPRARRRLGEANMTDADKLEVVVADNHPPFWGGGIALLSGGGLQAISRITAAAPSTRVIMLTASADEEHLLSAIRAGAAGYVLKDISADELVEIVRSVHAGNVHVAPSLGFALLHETSKPRDADPLDALSTRERDVLELVARGFSNHEIAERLGLAEQTV